ncbi:mucolipin-2-like isoform X2 [Carcharodon carcharias]|uniref:mucolipin-2-like isoform X2 n=1 Tax=Carcharodon carcharias TaxID=13397 RepID=UPI001B7DBFE9|nr:mucolipin-2-like isoform X2 [Carcharodon carcharias]
MKPDQPWGESNRKQLGMSENNFSLNQTMDFQLTTTPSADTTDEERWLKEDLNYFFMSPCEKYRARHQFPWKLCLQVLKIVMVTTQLILFGLSNQLVVSFKEENSIAFKHLFLKRYQDADKNDDSFVVYTQQEVYDSMSYAVNQYLHLQSVTVGNYGYDSNEYNKTSLQICKQLYMKTMPVISSDIMAVNPTVETDCINIEPSDSPKEWKVNNSSFFDLEFYRLILLEISFKLKGIDLQTIHNNELPDCYEFRITITFDNAAHSGIIKISLESETTSRECKDWVISGSLSKNTYYILIFDACVVLICLMSLVLCTRSIILGLNLHKRFITFFLKRYSKSVCLSDHLEFLNGWYILIIISDLMTITGSVLKMEITSKNLTTYDVCSIFLGTSTLFSWVGVIRYLGYFQKYNVLILTMRGAFPKVLRFCCCAGMIYLGYMFCGWIVLGPYHSKFEKLSAVAECLFSLINGDDMFATFAEIQEKSNLLWLFSRIYLYSFISLFIYMVLSLFIALITDTYETIKKYQLNGFPQTDLYSFMKVYKAAPELSRCFCMLELFE